MLGGELSVSSGSSPHTRGTPSAHFRAQKPDRFIPTHTGNTLPSKRPRDTCPVHPHTHGEHPLLPSTAAVPYGSSPHTRGTQWRPSHPYRRNRFIPTHTGNTYSLTMWQLLPAVHPHTHGEHALIKQGAVAPCGSSPHTRGTQPVTGLKFSRKRFIPTHTGNTTRKQRTVYCRSVHPHTHGEHISNRAKIKTIAGSSPHTRGTLPAISNIG